VVNVFVTVGVGLADALGVSVRTCVIARVGVTEGVDVREGVGENVGVSAGVCVAEGVVVVVTVAVIVGVCASAVHKLNAAKRREPATAILAQRRFCLHAKHFPWIMGPSGGLTALESGES